MFIVTYNFKKTAGCCSQLVTLDDFSLLAILCIMLRRHRFAAMDTETKTWRDVGLYDTLWIEAYVECFSS